MGNRTNAENWAARERLRAIERAAWWRGWVKRKDLALLFGVSMAQASSDLQKYQELNPGALVYQMSRKRYEGTEAMACLLHEPKLGEGLSAFLGGDARLAGTVLGTADGGADRVALISLPLRSGKPAVERAVVLAVLEGKRMRIKYWGVSRGCSEWRWVAPLAFGHDGYRWHVRAWCFEREGFRDFVLSRMEFAQWPLPLNGAIPEDKDWNEMVEVKVRASGRLDASARRAIEMDYGIRKNGVLRIPVRKAMEGYLLDHLRIAREDGALPTHFERA